MKKVLLPVAAALFASFAGATDYFVTPAGSGATCTQAAPCLLNTALTGAGPSIVGGDTIYLRAGTYIGNNSAPSYGFIPTLAGTAASPIVIRNYPGERAILDGNFSAGVSNSVAILLIDAPAKYLWFLGLEFTQSDTSTTNRNTLQTTAFWFNAETLLSPGIKIINCVFHDMPGQSVGWWHNAVKAEIYGSTMFYTGFWNGSRGAAHGVYGAQMLNQTSAYTKAIRDNMIFDGAGLGIQMYTVCDGSGVNYVTIEGNALWENGTYINGPNSQNQQLLIGTDDYNAAYTIPGSRAWSNNPESIARVANNYVYAQSGLTSGQGALFQFGYNSGPGAALEIVNNYGVGMDVAWHNTLNRAGTTMTGNEFWGAFKPTKSSELQVSTGRGADVTPTTTLWPGNTFSNSSTARPSGAGSNRVFYRPNQYEAGRGNIIIYNWENLTNVAVDLSQVGLRVNDQYAIYWAPNLRGGPSGTTVSTGTYSGGTVNINMTTLGAMPTPVAYSAPASVAPEFGAFVVVVTKRG